MKRLLFIAYHFPPLTGSSGIQRTLRFVQHLPRYGWEALVLTCHPRAYDSTRSDLVSEIPSGTVVERAFALDTMAHLSVRRRYPSWLARPDRWVTWWPDAVRVGRNMIRRYAPCAMLSTYPIATAHMIGHALARASSLPWIADFRDPMAQQGYPADPATWLSFKRIEERVFARAALCTFTTVGAAALYRERYPASPARVEVVENGYDEESCASACDDETVSRPLNAGVKTLLHSGIVYPRERDPTRLFEALRLLKARGLDQGLRIRFRAAVHDPLLHALARENGVESMIEILPHLPYREALVEMFRADGLLLLQASNCNEQVPAKLYECLRAKRPVIALTDRAGDTARVLRRSGIDAMAKPDDAWDIAGLLARFVERDHRGMVPEDRAIAAASRTARAAQLALLLDSVVDSRDDPSSTFAKAKTRTA